MTRVRVTHSTKASPEACWALMADFGNIDFFNPHLSESRLIGGSQQHGVGTERQCDLKGGRGYIRERIIDWQEGRSYTVDIYDGSMPVDDMHTTLGLEPRPGGGTELFMETTYRPRYGVLGTIADVLMIRRMLRGMLLTVIAGRPHKALGGPHRQRRAA